MQSRHLCVVLILIVNYNYSFDSGSERNRTLWHSLKMKMKLLNYKTWTPLNHNDFDIQSRALQLELKVQEPVIRHTKQ